MSIQDAAYWKAYREKNKERLKQSRIARYAANPQKFIDRNAEEAKRNRLRVRAYHKKWRDANPDKVKCYYRSYYDENKDRIAQMRAQPENRAKIIEANRKWKLENKDRAKELMRLWYDKNKHKPEYKEKIRAAFKRYYARHKQRLQIEARSKSKKRMPKILEYQKYRRKTDINFAIKDRVRASINRALRNSGTHKIERTMQLVGCSIEALKAHIESQFTNGQSWENRNEWHIDHHVPIAAFDLNVVEEKLIAFNWKNLRPLPCQENHIKGDTIPNPLPDWIPEHIQERIKSRTLEPIKIAQ